MPFRPSPMKRVRPFRLTRFFAITSLVGIGIVTIGLILAYRQVTLQHLLDHESRSHADLTRILGNDLWPRHRGFIDASRGADRARLLADPAQGALDADVRQKILGLQVVKLKIYNLDGLTVYSSDPRQIGEDKRINEAFQQARDGRVASALTHRDTFETHEGTLHDRNLIYSYVPVRSRQDGPPEAVFEVYSDVTALMARRSHAQWQIVAVVTGLLGALYLFLHTMVRRADRILSHKEAEIRHQSLHDALTGLPNRAYFTRRLARLFGRAASHGGGTLMFIDLDRFKAVNDTLGHQAGDQLLCEVAARLRTCLAPQDRLFRMGGDEFTVLRLGPASAADTTALARALIRAASSPMTIQGREVAVGACVGIAFFPGDGQDPETLVRHADAAMYRAKQSGRGLHAFFRADEPAPSLTP